MICNMPGGGGTITYGKFMYTPTEEDLQTITETPQSPQETNVKP